MKSRLLLPALILLLVSSAAPVLAQTRTVVTSGTTTSGGTVKITIEDFGKPEILPRLAPLSPQAIYQFDVPVMAGWNCAQVTTAMRDTLAANLPDYAFVISVTNPCLLYISKLIGANIWSIVTIEAPPGLIITVEDGVIPVRRTPWGAIKGQRYRMN